MSDQDAPPERVPLYPAYVVETVEDEHCPHGGVCVHRVHGPLERMEAERLHAAILEDGGWSHKILLNEQDRPSLGQVLAALGVPERPGGLDLDDIDRVARSLLDNPISRQALGPLAENVLALTSALWKAEAARAAVLQLCDLAEAYAGTEGPGFDPVVDRRGDKVTAIWSSAVRQAANWAKPTAPTTTRPVDPVPLADVSPGLLEVLRRAGDEWGPLGVAKVATALVGHGYRLTEEA